MISGNRDACRLVRDEDEGCIKAQTGEKIRYSEKDENKVEENA